MYIVLTILTNYTKNKGKTMSAIRFVAGICSFANLAIGQRTAQVEGEWLVGMLLMAGGIFLAGMALNVSSWFKNE